ncbi:MAG: rhomboid family intramembrane serine protease [Planctomycetaceae bacterium]
MRQLATLSDQHQAMRLASYLAVQGIEATADEEDGEWVIWIHRDDDRDRSKQILEEYLQNPTDERYEAAERKVRNVLREAERLNQQVRRPAERLKKRWAGSWWHSYPATYIMIGLCGFVVALCTEWHPPKIDASGMPEFCNRQDSVVLNFLVMGNRQSNVALQKSLQIHLAEMIRDDLKHGVMPEDMHFEMNQKLFSLAALDSLKALLLSGELWRPVTPAFIHLNLLHLLMNMMAFRNLGCAVEFYRGTGRYLVLCLILAVGSHVTQFLWSGPNFGGMSGVLFGLLGYIWMKGRTDPRQALALTSRGITFTFFWLILCMTGAMGNIANGAHLGGFVLGAIIGGRKALWKKLPFSRPRSA